MQPESLIEAARVARSHAYCPYSNFAVGAALLTQDGTVFVGCNVENASYGLTSCAERNAVFAAIGSGYRDFTHLALVLDGEGTPCGACRQVLYEFSPKLTIFLANPKSTAFRTFSIEALLPSAFSPAVLNPQNLQIP